MGEQKARTMKLRLFIYIWCLAISVLTVSGQEKYNLIDSLKLNQELLNRMYPDMPRQSSAMSVSIPTINPILGRDGIQYSRFEDFSITPFLLPRTSPSGVNFFGVGADDIFSKNRTAIASYSPMPRLNLHTAATLGLVETPFFGKANYYILNAGANYLVSPNLMAGISGSYNSDFDVLPYWNVAADLQYMPTHSLMLEGSVGYTKTAPNMFNLNQSAVQVDLHARQKITKDWYLNAYGGFPISQHNNQPQRPMMPIMNQTYYGGTVEHWFKPTVGAEAGIIMVRDMFSGKMRAQPKLELKFRPGGR